MSNLSSIYGQLSRYLRPAAATYQLDMTTVSATSDLVLADTGQLVANEYSVNAAGEILGGATADSAIWLQHRNAANDGDIRALRLAGHQNASANVGLTVIWPRITVATNERIRLVNGRLAAGDSSSAAGTGYWSASLVVKRV